jgi:hypothetical protein
MKKNSLLFTMLLLGLHTAIAQNLSRWSVEKANSWYSRQAWLLGANFVPSNSINQIEMWQLESFDEVTIDRELGYAASVGMNCMRVFLHDLVYLQDGAGYLKRIDRFLTIADKHGIRIMFVFFDSVWDPYPYLGKQRDPLPGVHNSGWVQGPGVHALRDSTVDLRLEKYVKAIVKRYAKDPRVFCWDIWNEPDNMNAYPYSAYEPSNKVDLVSRIIKKAFGWVRSQSPIQPLTTYVCGSGWADVEVAPIPNVAELVHFVMDNSDILSFHNYGDAAAFEKMALRFKKHGRPVLCTEFLARSSGSTFQSLLPIARKLNIGMMCWGLVAGKTNTIHGWHTWQKPDKEEPKLWHHDVFRKNGDPYSKEEATLMKTIMRKL